MTSTNTSTDTSTDTKSSTSADHAATVAAMYDAFGRGDVTFILDQLRDDVVWEEGIRPTNLPWLRPGTGKQHVGQFFGALGSGLQFTTFQPLTIAQSGNEVVSVIREGAVALATGAVIPEDLYVHDGGSTTTARWPGSATSETGTTKSSPRHANSA